MHHDYKSSVEIPEGSTVADVLKAASVTDQDILIRKNRTDSSLTDVVYEGDKILVVSTRLR